MANGREERKGTSLCRKARVLADSGVTNQHPHDKGGKPYAKPSVAPSADKRGDLKGRPFWRFCVRPVIVPVPLSRGGPPRLRRALWRSLGNGPV